MATSRKKVKVKRRPVSKQELVMRMAVINKFNGTMTPDEYNDLILFSYICYDWHLKAPHEQAWNNLVSVYNLTHVMLVSGYPADWIPELTELLGKMYFPLKQLTDRGRETGVWTMTGELTRLFPQMLFFHEQQLKEIPRKTMDDAILYCSRKMRESNGKSGNLEEKTGRTVRPTLGLRTVRGTRFSRGLASAA